MAEDHSGIMSTLLPKESARVIRAAGENPLAALALMMLLIFSLAAVFFTGSDEHTKLYIFLYLSVSVFAFGAAVVKTFLPDRSATGQPPDPQADDAGIQDASSSRHKTALVLLAVSVLSLAMAAAYWYLFYKDHYAYYGGFVRLERELSGVIPVSNDIAAQSNSVYRFKRRGRLGKVIEISRLNGSGGPARKGITNVLGDHPGNNCTNKSVHHIGLTYDEAGKIVQESNYDFQYRLLDHMRYTSDQTLARYEFESGASCPRTSSGASLVRFSYTNTSPTRLERVTFHNNALQPVANSSGAYGYQITYDKTGLTRTRVNLNVNYEQLGYRTEYVRGKDGRVSEEQYFDADGQPIEQEGGYASLEKLRDANHNVIKTCYRDRLRNLVPSKEGYSCVVFDYDESGNMIREAYLDGEGEPTYLEGYASFIAEHDELGRRIATRMFDRHGQPTTIEAGYAARRVELDKDGNLIKEWYYDIEGQPTYHADGYAERRRAHDGDGYVTQEAFFDLEGAPSMTKNGWHKVVYGYDDRHNITIASFFDEQEQPTINRGWGAAIVRWEFDNFSNETSVAFFDYQGLPIHGVDGIHRTRSTYNPQTGKLKETRYFDVESRPTFNKDGVHAQIHSHDEFGRVIETAYFGIDDNPVPSEIGALKVGFTKNNSGKDIEERYLDENGKLVPVKGGYAIKRMEYDPRGNMILESYFDVNLQPLEVDGVQAISNKYDRYNLLVERRHLDKNGSVVVNNEGWAIQLREHDARGRTHTVRYLDHDLQPVVREGNSFAIIRNRFDEIGRRTAYTLWLNEDQPVEDDAGLEISYDAFGNAIEHLTLDPTGDPATTDDYNRRVHEYNRLGKRTETRFLIDNDCGQASGIHLVKIQYNRRGDRIRREFFDCELAPTMTTWGASIAEDDRDRRGRATEQRYFGTTGEPVNLGDGNHRTTYKYDRFGREIEKRFFDIDGDPVVDTDEGFATKRVIYDRYGNVEETQLFDERGERINIDEAA